MAIVSRLHRFVVGVDTHARTHTFAILVAATGELFASDTFPVTASGMSRAIAWAARRTGGDMDTLWVIEGIGSYGAGIARVAAANGYLVVEAPRMNARAQRATGKSDSIDARSITAAVLPLDEQELPHPRRDDGSRAA